MLFCAISNVTLMIKLLWASRQRLMGGRQQHAPYLSWGRWQVLVAKQSNSSFKGQTQHQSVVLPVVHSPCRYILHLCIYLPCGLSLCLLRSCHRICSLLPFRNSDFNILFYYRKKMPFKKTDQAESALCSWAQSLIQTSQLIALMLMRMLLTP